MAKVKGKFITFAGGLMSLYKDSKAKAEQELIQHHCIYSKKIN